MRHWVAWNLARVVYTLAAVYTMQRMMPMSVGFGQLLLCAVLAIIGMRFWMSSARDGDK